jgi:hypothetical protein
MANQPWQHATGPRTEAGKEQARKNGKKRQKGQQSVRALRGELTEVNDLIQQMRNVVSSLPC